VRVPRPATHSRTGAHGDAAAARLDEIERAGGDGALRLPGGAALDVTNLARVVFPKDGVTKGDLMRYYARMAPFVLPTMADRPLVLRRFPNGIAGPAFYQQRAPAEPPAGVRVEPIEEANGATRDRFVGGSLATLLHTIQLGAISVDPWHARVGSLATPDYTIVDLDPGPKAPFARVVEVALAVKAVMDEHGLRGALKTSGSTGLHVYLPLPAGTPEETARLLAQLVATRVAERHPRIATIERSVRARPAGSVYVDYLQNIGGKTVAAAWCVRAKPGATVSTPLDWSELGDDLDPKAFTIESVPARAAKRGDGWAKAMKGQNPLTEILPRSPSRRSGRTPVSSRTSERRALAPVSSRTSKRRALAPLSSRTSERSERVSGSTLRAARRAPALRK
jgi:bifunctional non-homologous end joining protein LigD